MHILPQRPANIQRGLVAAGLAWTLVASLGGPGLSGEPLASLQFRLAGTNQETVSLSNEPDVELQVVCFLGTECPLARLYGPRLQRLADRYAQRVAFIGIAPNQQDSMEELRQYGKQYGIQFPLGKDYDQAVTQRFGATRTPEVFVLDRSGTIRYQGRIDDQYQPGITRSKATAHDLQAAIELLLDGQNVPVAVTEAVGCRISPHRVADSDSPITFADQISRVLIRNCVECHRSDEIGPFPLTDYDEVVGWSDMILEVIDNGRMPPWHATEGHQAFKNARAMSDEDRQLLHAWVDAGAPFGDASKLPELPEKVDGWRLPHPPDKIFAMSDKPFQVPAEGTVEYQYFVVDPGFETDQWLSTAEVIPGNRSVVHHCIVFVRPPDGTDMREIGFLSAYVPGQDPTVLPPGYARRIRAGSHFVLQMHYTPTGTPQEDLTSFGITFVPEETVTHEVYVTGGIEQDFEIPPRTDDFGIEGDVHWYPRGGELLAIAPHMHVRGKSFELFAERGASQETLLKVPQYDFNWQHNYQLSTPLPLADVDALKFRCTFDNSAANPNNPNPDEFVTWGDQTWEEMSVVFLQVARPLKPTAAEPTDPQVSLDAQAARRQRGEDFARKFIEQFDQDRDGFVSRTEVPNAFRVYQFRQTDGDRDGLLSHEELTNAALQR